MFCESQEHPPNRVNGCETCNFANKQFKIDEISEKIDPEISQLLYWNRFFEKGFLTAENFTYREMNIILFIENELQRLRNIHLKKMNEKSGKSDHD